MNTFQYTLTLDAFTAGGEQFPADSLTFTTNGLGQTPDLAGLSLYSQPLGFAQNVGNGMYMEIYSAEASVLYPPPLTAPEFQSWCKWAPWVTPFGLRARARTLS